MEKYNKYIIQNNALIKDALIQLDELAITDATLFVVDENRFLIGAITDGDIRRRLIDDLSTNDPVTRAMNSSPRYIRKGQETIEQLMEFRKKKLQIIPVLDIENDTIVKVINFQLQRSYLPIDAIIMAGGQGQRLRPLTENTPKPLLKVGGTPIIERNIDRLAEFGIENIHISVNYLGEQLESYFQDGKNKGININYLWENQPLGTIGAASQIEEFKNDYVLVMNSDLLTNVDFEHFFKDFLDSKADFSVLGLPYKVDIPYAVLEMEENRIMSLKEKPSYTYYSNGGIYLMKREAMNLIPKNEHYNATDLIERIIADGGHVRSFPMVGYWLDIGNHDDFKKAQDDVKHIKF